MEEEGISGDKTKCIPRERERGTGGGEETKYKRFVRNEHISIGYGIIGNG